MRVRVSAYMYFHQRNVWLSSFIPCVRVFFFFFLCQYLYCIEVTIKLLFSRSPFCQCISISCSSMLKGGILNAFCFGHNMKQEQLFTKISFQTNGDERHDNLQFRLKGITPSSSYYYYVRTGPATRGSVLDSRLRQLSQQ